MSNALFRQATPADKQNLLQLLSDRHDESNKLHGGNGNPVFAQGADIYDSIMQNKDIVMIVGELEGQIIATVAIYLLPMIRSSGYLAFFEDVLVAKDIRRKGIGRELMEFAIEFCKKDKRVKEIKLGIRKMDEEVYTFYEKLGFKHKEKFMKLSLD